MSSNSIINYCEKLLIHIKKCCNAMDIDGYVDAGVIGYFIRLPFKKIHRRHFAKIELYTTEIIKYIKDKSLLSLDNIKIHINKYKRKTS